MHKYKKNLRKRTQTQQTTLENKKLNPFFLIEFFSKFKLIFASKENLDSEETKYCL